VNSVTIRIPLLPASVNHYVEHKAQGVHVKSAVAKGFEKSFPLFTRGQFVMSSSGRFAATLRFTLGPKDRADVDNLNKQPLDCAAKAGMLRDGKGRELSDAHVKRLTVEILDSAQDRLRGPETEITLEVL
jgi:Holliday junction resolvase RusA-like endonuclease